MVNATAKWEVELERWLRPFLDRLRHKARRRMCPLYISGLNGPGDRKSVQPMAERLAPGDYDQLHHFVAAGVWDAAPLEAEPARLRECACYAAMAIVSPSHNRPSSFSWIKSRNVPALVRVLHCLCSAFCESPSGRILVLRIDVLRNYMRFSARTGLVRTGG